MMIGIGGHEHNSYLIAIMGVYSTMHLMHPNLLSHSYCVNT